MLTVYSGQPQHWFPETSVCLSVGHSAFYAYRDHPVEIMLYQMVR